MKNVSSAIALSFVVLSLSALAFFQATRGLDFSDEGFYLMNLSSSKDNFFHTPFALPLGQIWQLVGESVPALRLVAFVSLLAISIAWAFSARRLLRSSFEVEVGLYWPLIVGALTTLGFFGFGIGTPAYNFLSFLGVLISSGALLRQMSDHQRKPSLISDSTYIFVTGFGVAVSLFGKFSTSLVMVSLVIVFIFAQKRSLFSKLIRVLLLLVSVAFFIELLSVGRGVHFVIESVSYGAGTVLLMDPTYNPLASIGNLLLTALPTFASAISILGLSALVHSLMGKKEPRLVLEASLLVGVFAGFASSFSPFSWRPAVFLVIPLLWFLVYWKHFLLLNHERNSLTWRLLAILLVSFFAPIVGGNTGFLSAGIYATPFAMLLITFALSQHAKFPELGMKLVASVAALTLSIGGITNPYRQPSLLVQSSSISVASGTLQLDQKRSLEITTLRECIDKSKLTGDTAIDLSSGFSTGLIFLLGLSHLPNVIGTPWGYEGSAALMIRELGRQQETGGKVMYVALIEKSVQAESILKSTMIGLELGSIQCESENWIISTAEPK